MAEQKFYFSISTLSFIVIVSFLIGSAPFVFDRDHGYLYSSIMNLGGSPVVGYLLFAAALGVGLFHLPNLIRAVTKRPAITITDDFIRLHQFPARTIRTSEIKGVSTELGSMLLTLEGGKKKWVNLKIIESANECVGAVRALIVGNDRVPS
jgi:hypothetical protein